ncbi:hypothetical protein B0A52_01482 [Exophiala mesophila]|uniref:Peptidase M48 domain-containing protein n=1 Tax=Exophiala mesophila TaxID=212818 RepID=A0A438NF35_EXOME|nr:hypothetical protein B0A52_01482 [Exophiala mesophila]
MNVFSSLRATASRTVRSAQFGRSFQSRRTPFLQHQQRFASWQRGQRYERFGDQSFNNGQGKQQQQWSNFGPVYRAQYIWRNYRTPLMVASGGGGVFYVYNLEEVPVSHRRRFNFVSPDMERQVLGSENAYKSLLQEYRNRILPAEHPYTRQVAKVVEKLLTSTGRLADGEWRVHVIQDDNTTNAFVMPGGKVFVFTGMLKFCEDEATLAGVLGHEIAHNVAHHTAERASRSIFVMAGALALSMLVDIGGNLSSELSDLILSRPNSRTQESEADYIGLILMAESCYDPSKALRFWENMTAADRGQPPQFLSTHPSHMNRVEQIKKWLPEAQRVYEDRGCASLRSLAGDFRNSFRQQQQQPVIKSGRQPAEVFSPRGRRENDDDDDYF